MAKFLGLAGLVAGAALFAAPPATAEPRTPVAAPDGDYVVVALRRSSFVEGAAEADSGAFRIGARVAFGDTLHWLDGTICRTWRAEAAGESVIRVDDPNLSDLTVAPLGEPRGHAPASVQPYRLYCDGARLAGVVAVDGRVFVTHSPSGTVNAVLEKPLTEPQVRRLQAALRERQFHTGPVTGVMDEATRQAVSRYADHRGARYVFRHAAITEALLDGLCVLAPCD